MNEQKIEQIIEILINGNADEICRLINRKELKEKLELYKDKEEAIYENVEEIIKNIKQQIPNELKEYFEVKCYINGIDGLYDESKKDEYNKLFDEKFKEILNESDDKKIERLGEFPEEYKIEIVKSLKSDDKKIEILKELRDIEEVVKTIKDDNKKNEIIDLFDEDWEKEKIAKLINDDQLKLQCIDKIKTGYYKSAVAETLRDDNLKIKVLDKLEDYDKVNIIKNIKNDELKIQLIDKIEEEYNKVKVIETIDDDKIKITKLDGMSDFYKVRIIGTLKEDTLKLELIGEIEDDYEKRTILETIHNDSLKLELVKNTEDDYQKTVLILTIEDDKIKSNAIDEIQESYNRFRVIESIKDDKTKVKVLDKIENEIQRRDIAKFIKDDNLKIEALDKFDVEDNKTEVIKTLKSDDLKINFLDDIQMQINIVKIAKSIVEDSKKVNVLKKIEDKDNQIQIISTISDEGMQYNAFEDIGIEKDKVDLLFELKKENATIIETVKIDMLDEKYLDIFGEHRLNVICCYEEIQKRILNLDDKELKVFANCIERYQKDEERDSWTIYTNEVLKNINSKEYKELIDNIEDFEKIDIDKLSVIMQSSNFFDLKTQDDIKNFEEIKRKKCDYIMEQEGEIENKRKALLQKIYGQDDKYTQEMIDKYGYDIENIEEGFEKNYILSLKKIMEIEDEDVLREIYDECMEIEITDKAYMKETLNKRFLKKYNEVLYNTNEKEENLINVEGLEEFNVYNAGTDFSMLITAVGAYSGEASKSYEKGYDYKGNWNQPALGTQHFCGSFIRNDMLGTAPRPDICYGFCNLKDDALMMSGNGDIYSNKNEFVSKAKRKERYFTPNEQINKTQKYNEMDIRRFQGEERKQPDYIVAFKRDGKIENLDSVIKAGKNWENKLPIVVIDVNECLKTEKQKVKEMIGNFKQSKDENLAKDILQKIRNNEVTEQNFEMEPFTKEIEEDINVISEMIGEKLENNDEKKVEMKDMKEIAEKVTAVERKEILSEIKNLMSKIKNTEIERKENNEQR